MKYVLLSADNPPSVYSVPDEVACNLRTYCLEFCTQWLHESPHGKKYRIEGVVCYDEGDFIQYLNEWVFPKEPSLWIETLPDIQNEEELPEKYKECAWFNF